MKNLFISILLFLIQKKRLTTIILVALFGAIDAQVPANYYDSATPYTDGADLKQKLHDIITSGHSPVSYTYLWTSFQTTDRDDNASYENDGTVFDKYSENPSGVDPYNFHYTGDQCGTYSGEGSCYNREHSFPKSWWGGSTSVPQYTDLNHLIPSDGYVNGQRSNYAFGETSSPTFTSQNGCKLGSSSYSGITGTVFEPIDEFKGDFARMLFYMATRYKDEIPNWYSSYNTDMHIVFQSNGEFQTAYYDMIYAWHQADPVSAKEDARNDAVYDEQGNANPYIDHPEWVCEVFGTCTLKPEPDNYPTAFTATDISSSQIDLSWTDATGTNLPDGYLILANETGTFTDPVDAIDPTIDSDLSDGSAVVKVLHGAKGGYSFTGLTASTQYFFKIYSYTNSGTNIDFKTGVTPPTANATTQAPAAGSCASDLIISQVNENGADTYIEFANFTGSSVSLVDYDLVYYSNGSPSVTGTIDLSDAGNIADGDVWVLANSSATVLSPVADQTSGSLNQNGNDVYALRKSSTNIDVFGTIGSNASFYADKQFIRNTSVTDPTTTYSSGEWTITAYGGGDPGSLGSHTMTCASAPTLTVSPSTLTGFTYIVGSGPSTEQTFDISGTDLDGSDVILTAPTNYEISLSSGAGFTSPITLSAFNGTATTIYVRLKAGLSVNTYNGETISITGGGDADGESVSPLDGEVTAVPVPILSVNPTTLTGFSYIVGSGPSAEQTFDISGTDLDGTDVTLTAPTNYEISLSSGAGYTSPITLSSFNGTATTIYVRLKAGLSVNTYNGETISITGGGDADGESVTPLDGAVTAAGSGGVVINEIAANPSNSYTNEFIELYNDGASAVDLNGYKLIVKRSGSTDVICTIGTTGTNIGGTTIAAGGYFVITRGTVTSSPRIEWSGLYLNKSLHVILEDGASTQIDIAGSSYEFGSGNNYELCSPSTDNAPFANWTDQGTSYAGTEGALNAATCSATPTLAVSPSTLTGFTYIVGSGPSTEQTFDISGTDLDGSDVILTAPTNYEISLSSGAGYTSPITLSAFNGTATTIYVRLKAGLSVNTYNGETISITGGGDADGESVSPLDGEVTAVPVPTLSVNPTTLTGFSYIVGSGPSAEQTFDISGTDLDGTGVTLTAPTNYEISLSSGGGYTSPITLSSFNGTATTIYVRLKAGLSVNTYNGETISISGGGDADGESVTPIDGEVTDVPTVFISEIASKGHNGNYQDEYVEISNNGTSGVDMTGWSIEYYNNSDVIEGGAISLSGILAAGDAWVIAARTSGYISITPDFNGNFPMNSSCYVKLVDNTSTVVDEAGTATSDEFANDINYEFTNCTADNLTVANWDNNGISNGTPGVVSCISTCTPPTTQATNLTFTNITGTSMTLNWDTGDGTAGVIILAHAGSAVDADPSSGTDYVADPVFSNNTTEIGTGNFVVYKGDATTFDLSGLSGETTYYFEIYEYNTVDYCYLIPGLTGNQSTLCAPATTDATNMLFSSITTSSITVDWTSGDGANRIVVAKEGTPVDWVPTDFTSYVANASFGTGTEMGTGNYVVYNGNGASVSVSNLDAGTTYYFKVFEYNCGTGTEDYLTNKIPLDDFETTIPNEVSNFNIICTTTSSAELSWNLPSGNYDAVMIAVDQGEVPAMPSCDGGDLINPNTDYSSADIYCGNANNSVYVFNGVSNSVSITGLTGGLNYTFKAFVYTDGAWSSGVSISSDAKVTDATNFVSDCGYELSNLSWTNSNVACFDEVIVVASVASITAVPSSVPATYNAYNADPVYGNGDDIGTNEFIVYKGTLESETITNLVNGTTYFFKIFTRSGDDWSAGVEVSCAATTAVKLNYGDLAIVGVNTDAGTIGDEIQFVCFVDITTETSIDFTDNGYERAEAGKWGEGEGVVRFTRTGADLPAGTVVVIRGKNSPYTLNGTDWDILIDADNNGTFENDRANWSLSSLAGISPFDLNVDDQIWMMQGGEWTSGGSNNATYSGKVLYGWTATGWKTVIGVNDSPAWDTKGSRLVPGSECSNSDVTGVANHDKARYAGDDLGAPNGLVADASQRTWISRFNDDALWEGFVDNASYDAGGTLPTAPIPNKIGITGSGLGSDAKWTGETSENWYDCTNWLNLKVPDATSNITFVTDDCANDIVIAPGETPECKTFTTSGAVATHSIKLEGDATKILTVNGDVTLGGPSALDFDDGTASGDGILRVKGNWLNNVGTDGFLEGNSSVEFLGTGQQSISTSHTQEDFYNLTFNNTSAGGITFNSGNILTTGELKLTNGAIDLNGKDLTISGIYSKTNGVFKGNAISNILINGTGTLGEFSFSTPQELDNITNNRAETAILASSLTVNSQMWAQLGSFELSSGKFFTINTLKNDLGTSGLILKSDGTGTASLLNSSANIQATSERYLQADQWHFLSIPLDGVAKTQLTQTSGGLNNPNFYWYDESIADFWKGTDLYDPTGWTDESSATLSTVKGYVHRSNETRVYNLTGGVLENLDVPFTLSKTDNNNGIEPTTGLDWDEFEGWNMFVNPYPCALDWNAVWASLSGTEQTYLENGIYYMDNSDGSEKGVYKFFGAATMGNTGITFNGGSQIIPANQAVFIKATAAGAGKTITIPASARLHNTQSLWKKNKSNNSETNFIRLFISNGTLEDETIIRSLNNATFDHDYSIDAYKMFSWNSLSPEIYTSNADNSKYFGVNSIPEIIGHTVIPIKTYIANVGECSINNIQNSYLDTHVWLEDRVANKFIKFNSSNDSYTFNQNVQQTEDRFYLHFDLNHKPTVNANIPDQVVNVNEVYSYTISENIFKDIDFEDVLTLSVTQKDGTELPEWLSFNNNTNEFVGTPDELQVVYIKVTATDMFGASISQDYKLTVKSASSVTTNLESLVSIYPNPANDVLTIELPKAVKSKISIIDLTGKSVLTLYENTQKTTVNINDFSQGVYFIEIYFENSLVRKKIVIEY